MLLASCLLAALTLFGAIGPAGLLALTFVLGTGMALNGPAWQSSMCEAIDRTELAQALTLIGIAYNIARAVGPALAGAYRRQAGRGSYSSSMQPPTRGSSWSPGAGSRLRSARTCRRNACSARYGSD